MLSFRLSWCHCDKKRLKFLFIFPTLSHCFEAPSVCVFRGFRGRCVIVIIYILRTKGRAKNGKKINTYNLYIMVIYVSALIVAH